MSWYRTGTISLTNGSKNVTGTGTLFVSNVKSGFALLAPDFSVYEIDNISSDTAFTLKENYRGSTVSNGAYGIFQTQGIIKDLTDEVTALINTFGAFRDAYNNGDLIGQGLELKGILNNSSELPASPAVGDTYLIGTYLYVYSGTVGGWKNSNIAGIIPKGIWNASTAYFVNDTVTYNGSQYRRKVAGTTSTNPASDTTNWELFVSIGNTGPAGITPRGTWNSATAYVVNDTVQYNGSQYRRIVAGTTSTDPSTDTTNWELFVSRGLDGAGSVTKVNSISPDLSGNVTLTSDDVTEGSINLWFNSSRVRSTVLTGLNVSDSSDVAATDSILSGFGKLQAKFTGIADTVRSTVLTGLSTATNAAVAATDSILIAIGKLQKQITDLIAATKGPVFSAYQSTTQTIPSGTLTKVNFQSVEYDTATSFITASSRFQPNVAGYYNLSASVAIQVSPATTVATSFYKNGSFFKTGSSADNNRISVANSNIFMNGSTDYVEVYVFVSSGQNLVANAQSTVFSGFLTRVQ